jgi:hypothetical protein
VRPFACDKVRESRRCKVTVCEMDNWENLGSHLTDFTEFDISVFFRKTVEKIQVSSKSDKKNDYFT